MSFFSTNPILIPLVALVTAEVLKLLTTGLKRGRLLWKDFGRPGGLPSGHATLVASVTTVVLLLEGVNSVAFMISAVFGFLVIYDSVKLRWEAGRHAKVLNYLVGEKKLEERLGHTFFEMLAGVLLGVGLSFFLLSL